MPQTCSKCGTVVPGTTLVEHCPGCGSAFTPAGPTLTAPPDTGSKTIHPPSATTDQSVAGDRKVRELLDRIAEQSHFEERYDIGPELARGGMGVVFRAIDRILRREVAVKMMRVEGAGRDQVRGQFLKEARVGGRLLHPNILSVFDLGVNREGQIYYTMRLVDGVSLQACLDSLARGVVAKFIDFPLRRIVEALVGVCRGVDYAHQNRVLHLDLKPHNVLVSGFSEVFVIDWGLARVDDEDDTERLVDLYRGAEDGHTGTAGTMARSDGPGGPVVGTPGYMAAEQSRGDTARLGPATDVYGLGGILHFVLYGQSPNGGDSVAEMIKACRLPKTPRPLRPGVLPRGRRVRKEVQDALAALEAVCLKAVEPEPENRYPDAEALLIELSEWLAQTPGPPHGL